MFVIAISPPFQLQFKRNYLPFVNKFATYGMQHNCYVPPCCTCCHRTWFANESGIGFPTSSLSFSMAWRLSSLIPQHAYFSERQPARFNQNLDWISSLSRTVEISSQVKITDISKYASLTEPGYIHEQVHSLDHAEYFNYTYSTSNIVYRTGNYQKHHLVSFNLAT